MLRGGVRRANFDPSGCGEFKNQLLAVIIRHDTANKYLDCV